MKTKQMLMLTLVLLGVSLGREAQAFYNPSTGRWLSRDPIEESDSQNVVAYVGKRTNRVRGLPRVVERLRYRGLYRTRLS